MKKVIFIIAMCISIPIYAGWKSGLIGGGIGYMIGSSGKSGSYNEGLRDGQSSIISNLKTKFLMSDKKKYSKEELISILDSIK